MNSIICKLGIKDAQYEPTAYVPDSVFLNCPADVSGKRANAGNIEAGQSGAATSSHATPNRGSYKVAPLQHDPPDHTDIPCQWCMHSFEGTPVGVPVKKTPDGKFETFGVFCSLECASAYNFDTHHASHTAYLRHTLCCEIASIASGNTTKPVRVRPAPAREMLQLFGGPMTIEEFRASDSPYPVLYPLPINARHQHAENLMFSSTDVSGPKFVPIDDDTIDSLTSGLRRPPVSKKGYKSTLDYMCVPSVTDA